MSVSLNFQFDELKHAYMMGSYAVPSVTTILSESGLSGDLSQIPKAVLERKREIGTQVHAATQFIDEGRGVDWGSLDKKVTPYVLAFERFKEEHIWQPRLIEFQMVVTCDGMPFGMTIDRDGLLDGDPWVLDIKNTYDKRHEHWRYQTAAYTFGATRVQNDWKKAYRRGILWLRKTGDYEIIEHKDDRDWEIFKAALLVTHAKRGFQYEGSSSEKQKNHCAG